MLWQLGLNAIVAGAVIALVALGLGMIYRTSGFFHFAHGVVFTAGAYCTYLFNRCMGVPVFLAVPLAVALSSLVGVVVEVVVYRPLRHRRSSALVLLLCSLGIYIALQNSISMAFGDDIKTIGSAVVEEGINILGARVTPIQGLTVFVSLALTASAVVLLKKTKRGRALRAVASDPELASLCGIYSDGLILYTFAVGSALAGIAGILVALDVGMTPTMGLRALMMGIVAMIIGGVGSIPGIALGALLLGMAQHFGVWKIGSQWQDAIAFVILLVFLLFRPRGFLGKEVRKATV